MNKPNKPFYERCYERIEAALLLANAIKEQITAVMVAPLIADSQTMVSVSEAAARASQLKVDF